MQLVSIAEASQWACDYLDKEVTPTNIAYLIQYGKVKKQGANGVTLVDLDELQDYYTAHYQHRSTRWKQRLGSDLNWALSFDHLREKDTTKHVHRLHPYKGKFIPQLVEYFIDGHCDDFKTSSYFQTGDIILDPFSGSGTTAVQANEMGIHAIGIDVSQFNNLISKVKLRSYDFVALQQTTKEIQAALKKFDIDHAISAFEQELVDQLRLYNARYFPSPDFKYQLQQKQINETTYGAEKQREFLAVYTQLLDKYAIDLRQSKADSFLDIWYCKNVRDEIDFVFSLIRKIDNAANKQALALILSRTIRSCRATAHADLATLKEPQLTTYYCWKHKKICKPLYSIRYWFDRYAKDTLARLQHYSQLKSRLEAPVYAAMITADSRHTNIAAEVKQRNPALYEILRQQKIRGIFTSPPYVGQIDYHEQHAYAYDLFGFERRDDLEIGPLCKGQGQAARASYVTGIADVLNNCKRFLRADYDIFIVANDKYNLYPTIAEKAGMQIIEQFKRPVLNRTERDHNPYSEIIFHCKAK